MRHARIHIAWAALALLLSAGCSHRRELGAQLDPFSLLGSRTGIVDQWVGRPDSSLIASWGRPSTTLPDAHHGRILTYLKTIEQVAYSGERAANPPGYQPGEPTPEETRRHARTVTLECVFQVDSTGRIFGARKTFH
ncbi:MAG TPA: hypothetical protein VMS93_00225 [Candidatus Saccharimonadales bacterium]|nr:hypothetical protein [Candidatus Saccharimonadales bacterium]